MTKKVLDKTYIIALCCIIFYTACILSSCKMENKISAQDKFEESVMYKTEKASDSDDKEIKRLYNPEDFEKVTLSKKLLEISGCLLYTSPSPRDRTRSRMPSSA